MNYFNWITYSQPTQNITYSQPQPTTSLLFQVQLYAHCNDTLYTYTENNSTWTEITFTELPEEVTVTKSGEFYVQYVLGSSKLAQGEYIGDPVEEVTNTCICLVEALMSYGCKCGGD